MIESKIKSAEKHIKSLISPKIMKLLQQQKFSGAKVLTTKLKSD